jgi:hypothetical protein
MKNNPTSIVIHTTDYSYRLLNDQFVACNGWHRDRQFPVSSLGCFIGYHRLITGGVNYKCRLETDEGAHCNQKVNGLSMNFQSLGVCVGFDGDIEMVRPEEYVLLQKQVWDWQDFYKIPDEKVFFHRHFATNKTCPGSLITNQWLVDLLKRPLPVVPKPAENICMAQEKIIAEQKVKIAWYEKLLALIKTYV